VVGPTTRMRSLDPAGLGQVAWFVGAVAAGLRHTRRKHPPLVTAAAVFDRSHPNVAKHRGTRTHRHGAGSDHRALVPILNLPTAQGPRYVLHQRPERSSGTRTLVDGLWPWLLIGRVVW
jgi:hypothetical protein